METMNSFQFRCRCADPGKEGKERGVDLAAFTGVTGKKV